MAISAKDLYWKKVPNTPLFSMVLFVNAIFRLISIAWGSFGKPFVERLATTGDSKSPSRANVRCRAPLVRRVIFVFLYDSQLLKPPLVILYQTSLTFHMHTR